MFWLHNGENLIKCLYYGEKKVGLFPKTTYNFPLKCSGLVVTSPQSSDSLPFHVEKALFRFSTIQF